ncbi:MAG: 16S rRNA (adenine(1518)-N(6)/adenine(1519)-N(6))-dimethyltransferase RsmA [Gammaproteobacteria bacterium]|nr:16S rRNA (adenine(1518)-N(6)/adenine(1519)-N(6))-dimethyltransferase RsmA [Gammaproteobacteria bacterium]
MQHRPRKRFGQNFLEDFHVIQNIIKAIHPKPDDNLLEIGPGLGALTRPLLTHVNTLTAIEIDTDLHAHLATLSESTHTLNLICEDALTVDFKQFGKNIRVVGNLPYNISTPLLFHLLDYAPSIQDMHFMLQKEVVNRLSASPGTKAYGRLSVMTQAQCTVESLFLVPPTAFNPAPKVDSAIVRLTPLTIQLPKALLNTLESLVLQAFSMRRKTLSNTLKNLLTQKQLIQHDIDPKRRPETLSVEEYIKLAKYLTKA